ncbi:M23 family metallopeptidase [Actinoalloteichus hymeniacidonis]|uniref:Peptidase family M23 n=1 Tax=Actinoalloteichus hymeniacidonis TaxID=340345 RepID=A0AAC9MYB7_9PSEU|nr:M23 family metallopeptidase [Actinoalloteichus hymeniacidonis]AOS62807.1 Peptidase family M23 [Actinoalloteichus hymeniacidonis]MBB5909162.1 murein DD-endopeptidase MepM/ murein hydrolase activator NlpD [Actinoalloteichus hymeniacidonis]
MTLRRRIGALATAFAISLLGLVVGQGTALAAPNYQVPFECGETVNANTRTNHSPVQSVDFQRSNINNLPVLASAAGRVSRVENTGSTSYGRWIEINHGSGFTTRYAHLSSQSVSVGTQVRLGQQIGRVGSTGGSTGPHLHYEQRSGGSPVRVTLHGVAVPYYGNTNFTSENSCPGGGNPYTPTEVCGTGYRVINQRALGTAGTVYLTYNSSNQHNCVVTLKSKSVGTPTATSAFLEVQGQSRQTDSGSFGYYAGPVRKAAGSTCVKWGGSAGGQSYTSPFEHCG